MKVKREPVAENMGFPGHIQRARGCYRWKAGVLGVEVFVVRRTGGLQGG